MFFPILIVCALMAVPPDAEKSDDKNVGETLLFECTAAEGTTLAVLRGPDRKPADLGNVAGKEALAQWGNMYTIRVELRSPGVPPVDLASRLRVENHVGRHDRGVVVLDALVEPGLFVLATAEGSNVALWQISVGKRPTCWIAFHGAEGFPAAAKFHRRDRDNVSMKLGRTTDGRLTVELVDKLVGPSHPHFSYEQTAADGWDFKLVRKWNEKPK